MWKGANYGKIHNILRHPDGKTGRGGPRRIKERAMIMKHEMNRKASKERSKVIIRKRYSIQRVSELTSKREGHDLWREVEPWLPNARGISGRVTVAAGDDAGLMMP